MSHCIGPPVGQFLGAKRLKKQSIWGPDLERVQKRPGESGRLKNTLFSNKNAPTRFPFDCLRPAHAIMPEALNIHKGVPDVHSAPHSCF